MLINAPKSFEFNFPRITFFSSMAVFCCNTKLVEKSPLICRIVSYCIHSDKLASVKFDNRDRWPFSTAEFMKSEGISAVTTFSIAKLPCLVLTNSPNTGQLSNNLFYLYSNPLFDLPDLRPIDKLGVHVFGHWSPNARAYEFIWRIRRL